MLFFQCVGWAESSLHSECFGGGCPLPQRGNTASENRCFFATPKSSLHRLLSHGISPLGYNFRLLSICRWIGRYEKLVYRRIGILRRVRPCEHHPRSRYCPLRTRAVCRYQHSAAAPVFVQQRPPAKSLSRGRGQGDDANHAGRAPYRRESLQRPGTFRCRFSASAAMV